MTNTNSKATEIRINYYDATGTKIVRTGEYRTQEAADAALRRAAKRGQIASVAGRRTERDQPTCHH